MKLNACNRDSLCTDCPSAYTCDNDKPHDCEHCEWVKKVISESLAMNSEKKK